MNIADILNPTELERLVAEHYISRVVRADGALVLYNYTDKATYDRVWTPETRQCRGLIVDAATGRIVAHPFDKFFNVGEAPDTALEVLVGRDGAIEATDKLDGSMITVFWYDGNWRTATRGSFTSPQAQTALNWLRPYRTHLSPHTTYLCEWTAPDNRVVLKYDAPQLTLIGARHVYTDLDYGYQALETIAADADLPLVPILDAPNLEHLVARLATDTGREGWVVRWPDGFRVKFKCEDYLRLHRLFSGFSAGRIRECMLDGTLDRYLIELPEELRPDAERYVAGIRGAIHAHETELQATYARLAPLQAESRKAFALAVQQEPALYRPWLFALADNKPYADKLIKALDLTALFDEVCA